MNIFVCIKRVPDTSEAIIRVDDSGKCVDTGKCSYDINEADNCAVEEAMLLKEAKGGKVQVVCAGTQDSDMMIRMALAKGGDSAIRIDDSRINYTDPLQVAKVLAAVIKDKEFDLIFTGCMAADDGNMAVGVALAEELGIPHASIVKKVEAGDCGVKVYRELEGGSSEVVEMNMPAVITIQTGANEPRYAPIRGIRRAQKKELSVLTLDDLDAVKGEVGEEASLISFEGFYVHKAESKAEIIAGEPEAKAAILAQKLVKGGLL